MKERERERKNAIKRNKAATLAAIFKQQQQMPLEIESNSG